MISPYQLSIIKHGKKAIEVFFMELKQLKGIGEKTEKTLNRAGTVSYTHLGGLVDGK